MELQGLVDWAPASVSRVWAVCRPPCQSQSQFYPSNNSNKGLSYNSNSSKHSSSSRLYWESHQLEERGMLRLLSFFFFLQFILYYRGTFKKKKNYSPFISGCNGSLVRNLIDDSAFCGACATWVCRMCTYTERQVSFCERFLLAERQLRQ